MEVESVLPYIRRSRGATKRRPAVMLLSASLLLRLINDVLQRGSKGSSSSRSSTIRLLLLLLLLHDPHNMRMLLWCYKRDGELYCRVM